jgi:hypothetical protein
MAPKHAQGSCFGRHAEFLLQGKGALGAINPY